MNLIKLSLSYIRRQKLNTMLNTLLLGLGIGTIVLLLLFSAQFGEKLTRDAKGIDMVVGAKGSPLQLILSGIYHLDVPTGNIPLSEAEKVMHNRFVKEAIPLALGDSYKTYRIVGTNESYPKHYGATFAEGKLFAALQEAVIGSQVAKQTGLKTGDSFVSAHGLVDVAGMKHHDEHQYKISGVLNPTGTVLDNLILTSIESVWDMHGLLDKEEEAKANAPVATPASPSSTEPAPPMTMQPIPAPALATPPPMDANAPQASTPEPAPTAAPPPMGSPMGSPPMMPMGGTASGGKEITVLLVKFASPIAAITMPRGINAQTNMQAARPAEQMANLLQLIGVGLDTVRAFGWILVLSAALGVFIALYNAMRERRYDMAIMRSLGASQTKLMWHVLIEGLIYATLGLLMGLILGHGVAEIIGRILAAKQQVALTGFTWVADEWKVVFLAIGVGLVAAIIPAIQAYRTDIAKTLAR